MMDVTFYGSDYIVEDADQLTGWGLAAVLSLPVFGGPRLRVTR